MLFVKYRLLRSSTNLYVVYNFNFIFQNIYLCLQVSIDDAEFEQRLIGMGLLHHHKTCTDCNTQMNLRVTTKAKQGVWRCRKRDCARRDKEIGFYVGTFFEGSKLTIKEIVTLSFYWSMNKLTFIDIQKEMKRDWGSTVSDHTITDWFQFFRCKC